MADDMKVVVSKQRDALAELSAQIKLLEKSDLFVAHQEHRNAYEKLSARYERAESERQRLVAENANLKTALYDQYFSEKTRLLANRQEKIDIYFKSELAQEENRLCRLEHAISQRIGSIQTELGQNHVDIADELYGRLAELSKEAQQKITQAREKMSALSALTEAEREAFAQLRDEPLTEEQVVSQAKKNSVERFVGLNLLNVIGVVLIIIGVIAAGQFAYVRMGDMWRGMLLFSLGGVLLVVGEVLNRRRANVFSFGITAGGVGVLYAALAVSYFMLGILSLYVALAVCVGVTALSFFLSTRYHAQTLLAMALVGGYLPILAIEITRPILFSAMGYFVILNLLALSVAFRRKWTVASFVGLGLNLAGTAGLSFLIYEVHPFHERAIEMVFILFAMLIYIAIPLVGTYITKTRFRMADVVLLAMNTLFGSLIFFVNLSASGWGDGLGLASLLFAVFYFGVGYIIGRKFQGETAMSVLFFITGVSFAVLAVPFQLDMMWFTLGWLVQGTCLAVYGIVKERRRFSCAGFIIGGLSLFWFVTADFLAWQGGPSANPYFAWQYLSVTAASLFILAAFLYKGAIYRRGQKAYLYCVALNLWVYVLFLVSRLNRMLVVPMQGAGFDRLYLMFALACVATLLLGALYRRIPRIQDTGISVLSTVMSICSVVGTLVLNVARVPVAGAMGEQVAGVVVLATVVLVALGAVGGFAVYDLSRRAVLSGAMGVQYLPLMLSAYIVVQFTVNLVHAYGLSFASFWISVVYVLAALLWTIVGFMKRYTLLRRFGLGLALFTVTKLFLVDLHALTQGFRILSYFILGVVLIGISFVYQYFSKRLEVATVQDETVADGE